MYHTHANSTLKCRIIISIIARSFCSYNNILINFGQLYSNRCYITFSIATLGMCIACEFHQLWVERPLYLSHISAPHKLTYFLPNWPCKYGMPKNLIGSLREVLNFTHSLLKSNRLLWNSVVSSPCSLGVPCSPDICDRPMNSSRDHCGLHQGRKIKCKSDCGT